MISNSKRSGLTLIEVIIAIAIFTVIMASGLLLGVSGYKRYILDSERDLVVSLLLKARSSALGNVNQSSHGFYATSEEFTVFQGESYLSRDLDFDEIFPRDAGADILGVTEMVFDNFSGQTSGGTITISNEFGERSIIINTEGMIEF